MIELSDGDLAALVECATLYGLAQALHAAHRAGLAAGIERAAEVCENTGLWTDGIGPDHCAAAIRLLNPPA